VCEGAIRLLASVDGEREAMLDALVMSSLKKEILVSCSDQKSWEFSWEAGHVCFPEEDIEKRL